ncbi:MAG: hypothetical protein ABIA11_03115 [Patescibacteria group bacterium]
MRVLIVLVFTFSIWVVCRIVVKTLIDSGERQMHRAPFLKFRERIQKRYAFFLIPLYILAIYAPVVSVFLEAKIRNQIPLMNIGILAAIVTTIVVAVGIIYYIYYLKVLVPKRKKELSELLRKWLSKGMTGNPL